MTTAYEAYAIVRGDSDPAPRAGLVELGFQPERRWTPEGIAAGVTFLSVAAYHDSHSTHIRVQGTDRDKVLATAQGLVDAVARREPIPTDDLPGVAPAGEQPGSAPAAQPEGCPACEYSGLCPDCRPQPADTQEERDA